MRHPSSFPAYFSLVWLLSQTLVKASKAGIPTPAIFVTVKRFLCCRALAILESDPNMEELLLKPLRLMTALQVLVFCQSCVCSHCRLHALLI